MQEDFFRDLEKEVGEWSETRTAAGKGKPASLWEELAAIGEELVDFLEQGLPQDAQAASAGGRPAAAGGGGSSSKSRSGPSSKRGDSGIDGSTTSPLSPSASCD